MSVRKGRVFYFPSRAFVFNDKFLPVVLELARQGNKVHTVFSDFATYNALVSNRTYMQWLNALTTPHVLKNKPKVGPFGLAMCLLRVLWVAFLIMWHRKYVAFFDPKPVAGYMRVLTNLAHWRGRIVLFTGRYFEFKPSYSGASVSSEDASKLQKRAPSEKAQPKPCHSIVVYNSDQIDKLEGYGDVEFKVLGQPKMQHWWKSFLAEYPPVYDDERLSSAEEYVSVFLTHYGNYFFEEGTDLDGFVRDIVAAVRKTMPDVLIAVKPKGSVDQGRLEKDLAAIGDHNLLVTMTPVTFLAEKSIVGITVCHTSAQFEFAWSAAPWVEYCRYSGFWKEYYPGITYTETFGGVFCRYYEELEECLRGIREKCYDQTPLKQAMGFVPRAIDFDFFYSLGASEND